MDSRIFTAYISVFVIMGLSDSVIPILPKLVQDPAISSILFSAYFVGALVAMLPFGILADRYGNKPFIILSIILTIISGFILFFSDNIYIMIIARFIEGTACAAFFPAAFSMLARFKRRDRYMGEFNFLINAGLGAGMGAAGLLAGIHQKGGILFFTLIALAILPISMTMKKCGATPDTGMPPSSTMASQLKSIYKLTMDSRYTGLWAMSFILFGFTGVIVASYPEYTITTLTDPQRGIALGGLYIGAMVMSLIAGNSNIDRRVMIRSGMFVTGAGAIVLIFHPVGLVLLGAGSGFAFVGLVLAVSEFKRQKGAAMGLFNTWTYAGFSVLPVISGLLLPVISYAELFIASGIFLIGAGFLHVCNKK